MTFSPNYISYSGCSVITAKPKIPNCHSYTSCTISGFLWSDLYPLAENWESKTKRHTVKSFISNVCIKTTALVPNVSEIPCNCDLSEFSVSIYKVWYGLRFHHHVQLSRIHAFEIKQRECIIVESTNLATVAIV